MGVKLAFAGLAGAVLNFANAVQRAFDNLSSVRLTIVADVATLPPASQWQGRQVIVRDIDGLGAMGTATALDGAWYDYAGGAL